MPKNTSVAAHLRRLLELLAAGAPAEDFSAVATEARRVGAGADDLAEIEQATQGALRVHSALRQHQRREAELTALFDTAGDLAALRDLDAVLRPIVRRARMLLGTDTAYLTLPDEEAGDTFMRVTDGSVSVLSQNLRRHPLDPDRRPRSRRGERAAGGVQQLRVDDWGLGLLLAAGRIARMTSPTWARTRSSPAGTSPVSWRWS